MADEDDPFESPRLLLSGAARHIAAFEARVAGFRQEPDTWDIKATSPGETVIRVAKPVPPELKQIAFDVVANLRAALDQAVFASTMAIRGKELDGTKFPFGDDAKGASDNAKGKCKDVPHDVVDYLLRFEPYRMGNPLLWGLNKLRNTKSHRMLVPVVGDVSFQWTADPDSHPGWDAATGTFKQSLKPAQRTGVYAALSSFRLEILIGTGAFRGEPAAGIFGRLLGEVERVVSGIEAETARLLRERGS
jgi:hypothetical protein